MPSAGGSSAVDTPAAASHRRIVTRRRAALQGRRGTTWRRRGPGTPGKETSVTITQIGQPGRLAQPWIREIVPGVFRVGTTFLGCYAVEDAGAYTFIDGGLPR